MPRTIDDVTFQPVSVASAGDIVGTALPVQFADVGLTALSYWVLTTASGEAVELHDQSRYVDQTISAKLTLVPSATYHVSMIIKTTLSAKTILRLYGGFVLLPLGIAVLIYCMFRVSPPPLLKLVWHQPPLKLDSSFDGLVYNVPDGLWAFALMSFLVLVCRDDSMRTRRVYYATGVALMVALEVLQGSLLPGTFDPMDLLAILFGACAAWFFLSRCLSR